MIREYTVSLISLLKGIIYDYQKEVWYNLIQHESEVRKYFAVIGVELWIDKSEGYAYLKQKELEEELGIPKLAEKRQLNFHTTLVCLLLRKYLLEHDAHGGGVRAIINQQEIINRLKIFLPGLADEAKQQDRVVAAINKVIDMGFLRKLEDTENNYEVHRIIKGFIDAEVIENILQKLQQHVAEKSSVI